MRQCLDLQSHGYEPNYITSFALKEISEREFKDGLHESDDIILTRFPKGNYTEQETIFFERENSGREEINHPEDGPIPYYLSLESTGGADGNQPSGGCYLEVIDAAGELSTPSGPTEEDWERHRVASRPSFALRMASSSSSRPQRTADKRPSTSSKRWRG